MSMQIVVIRLKIERTRRDFVSAIDIQVFSIIAAELVSWISLVILF